eukprot:1179956-Prorocentrum_minimum.AAC.6
MRGTNIQIASYQRCEHPRFPGASSACNVRNPWTYPSPVRSTGVQCGIQCKGEGDSMGGGGVRAAEEQTHLREGERIRGGPVDMPVWGRG